VGPDQSSTTCHCNESQLGKAHDRLRKGQLRVEKPGMEWKERCGKGAALFMHGKNTVRQVTVQPSSYMSFKFQTKMMSDASWNDNGEG
jgi:hypothetical protein